MKNNIAHLFENLTQIQIFKLKLLEEFDEFCTKHKIEYSIGDELLVAILKKEPIKEYLHNVSVFMTPLNYFKYLELIDKNLAKDRVIENIYTNIYYPYKNTRYIATNSLATNIIATSYLNNGLYITVKMLGVEENEDFNIEKIEQNRYATKIKSLSKHLYEPFKIFTYPIVKNIASKMIKQKNQQKEQDEVAQNYFFYLSKKKEKVTFAKEDFEKFVEFEIGDFRFKVSEYFLNQGLNLSPKLILKKYKAKNPQSYIESTTIDYKSYFEASGNKPRIKLYFNGFFDKLYLYFIRKIEKNPYSMNRYLKEFAFRFYLFKFKKELLHSKKHIALLVEKNSIDELEKSLG